ncbi:uncharacterized protein LOC125502153 isoform X2 [Athalia rosae]|uniref:uncharacterized protein LOC125502153 isoform X2 n=1 Tax=Athalia rosae TaxID=37344 RepID=UPI0020337C55|nr:uncharacterized protein LOC125502153 isoform X2 [Athalia rosae]
MDPSAGPPVKCGYCGWLIQGCANIVQRKSLEHYDDSHFLRVDDNLVVTLINRKDDATQVVVSQEVPDDSPDTDELLIQAVVARPALNNIKFPVRERTKLKKDALWLEISNILGGT